MIPDFDAGTDPTNPIPVRMAVNRGHVVITLRVISIMLVLALTGVAMLLLFERYVLGIVLIGSAPFVAWIWWSFATPRWRYWAEQRGANPAELQRVAEQEKLVWPRGHLFERTEFPYRG